jgi:protein translocase SecG subunit
VWQAILKKIIDANQVIWYLLADMILNILQIILAILLVGSILMQAQGTGLGAGFGGEGNVYRTKRGVEQKLHQITILLSILFFGISLANVLY